MNVFIQDIAVDCLVGKPAGSQVLDPSCQERRGNLVYELARSEAGSLAQMGGPHDTRIEQTVMGWFRPPVEPMNPSIRDLIAPETHVKPTKKGKRQSRVFALPNYPSHFLYLQPVFPPGRRGFWYVKIVEEISPHELVAPQIFEESL